MYLFEKSPHPDAFVGRKRQRNQFGFVSRFGCKRLKLRLPRDQVAEDKETVARSRASLLQMRAGEVSVSEAHVDIESVVEIAAGDRKQRQIRINHRLEVTVSFGDAGLVHERSIPMTVEILE